MKSDYLVTIQIPLKCADDAEARYLLSKVKEQPHWYLQQHDAVVKLQELRTGKPPRKV
jgi:hypothetical protein